MKSYKLTDELIGAAEQLASQGNSPQRLWVKLPVSGRTWRRWMKVGRTAKSGQHKKLYDNCWAGYTRFLVNVESTLIREALEHPHKMENKRLLRWLLESHLPEEYGKKKEVTVRDDRDSRPTKVEVVYKDKNEDTC